MRGLGGLVLFGFVVFAGAVGCGIDDPPVASPTFPEIETLLSSRTYFAGDVEIDEQVFRTNTTRAATFTLRARLTNLGADLADARYELVLQRERDVPPPGKGVELVGTAVAAAEQLGTLHSSQTAVVTLRAEQFGVFRTQAKGQLATPSGIVGPKDDAELGPAS